MSLNLTEENINSNLYLRADRALGYRIDDLTAKLDAYANAFTDAKTVPVLYILGQSNGTGYGRQDDSQTLKNYVWRPVVTPAKDGFTIASNGAAQAYNASAVNPIAQSPPVTQVLQEAPVRVYYKPDYTQTVNGSWADIANDKLMAANASSFGIELPVAYYWATKIYPLIKKPLHIVKMAMPGTYLGPIAPGVNRSWTDAPDQCWQTFFKYCHRPAMISLQEAGIKPSCIGVVWMQGEADSDPAYNLSSVYGHNLRDLIVNRIRGRMGFPNAKIYIMGLSNWGDTVRALLWNRVKAAQQKICVGSNAVDGCFLIPTDGTDGVPCQRHLVSSGLNSIHYSSNGLISFAAKLVNMLDWDGDAYIGCNDFEFVAACQNIGQLSPSVPIALAHNTGGELGVGDVLHTTDYRRGLTWFASANVPERTVWRDATASIAQSFSLTPLDGATDQEIILKYSYRMGQVNGSQLMICLRSNYNPVTKVIDSGWGVGLGTDSNTAPTAYGMLIYSFQQGSPSYNFLTPTTQFTASVLGDTIAGGESIYYKITLIGNVITVFVSKTLGVWNQLCTYTDSANVLPTSGKSYMQLFGGLARSSFGNDFPCCFDVIVANKL